MRINRQTLLKLTNDTVQKRVKESHSILAAYLVGSLNREEDPFLGDSTDIDLVIVHEYEPEQSREIVSLTEDITLDITHHNRVLYRLPRELRSHPWLGPGIYNFAILHDPRHFLDFAQASLRDQFFAPSNVLARAQVFAAQARQAWLSLLSAGEGSPDSVGRFLQAAADSANALVSLDGDPLTERRLLTLFFERTEAMGQPALYTRLLELLGAGEMNADDLNQWITAWDGAYSAAAAGGAAPASLALRPERKGYYRNAFAAQLQSGRPADALWPLLATWTRSINVLGAGHRAHGDWKDAMTQIGLLGAGFAARLEALDSFLDLIEETLEAWGKTRGVGDF